MDKRDAYRFPVFVFAVIAVAVLLAVLIWVPWGGSLIFGPGLMALLAYGVWLRIKERRSKASSK